MKQSPLRIWIERVYAFDDWLYGVGKDSPSAHLITAVILWTVVCIPGFVLAILRPRLLIVIAPIVALCTAVIPVALSRYKRMLVEKRRKLGQCVHCGYDLRESPARCPECGPTSGIRFNFTNTR